MTTAATRLAAIIHHVEHHSAAPNAERILVSTNDIRALLAAHAAEREGWEAQIVGLRAELKHVESVAPVGPGRAADRLVGEIARLRAALEEVRGAARRRLVPECAHGVTIARECAECDSGSAVGYSSAVGERNVVERLWSDAEARLEALRPTYESAITARRAWTPTRDAHDRIERTAGYLVDEVGKALALSPAAPAPQVESCECNETECPDHEEK